MFQITWLSAHEILDSRGRPTLSVTLEIFDGPTGHANVPSGASKGLREAFELRDGDAGRYGGFGVQRALGNVMGEIANHLRGVKFRDLAELDTAMIELDGTTNKRRLGANAIVGVSMAASRALASAQGLPLWDTLEFGGVPARLPVPHFNLVNGGMHANNGLDFQEFMIAPIGAPTFAEALRAGAEIYDALRGRLIAAGLSVGLGDEGGFAPELSAVEQVLSHLVGAIEDAGYEASRSGVALALDPAATQFYRDGAYHLGSGKLTSDDMIEWYSELVHRFPIWSIEDGLAELDWSGWEHLQYRMGDRLQIVGDDLFVTNAELIAQGIDRQAANAALIKPNQIGTVTETLQSMRVCRDAGWAQMVSHRSGDTDDPFIADLAVGTGCGQIKSGAPARGERLAKYNRLVEIEADAKLPYGLAS